MHPLVDTTATPAIILGPLADLVTRHVRQAEAIEGDGWEKIMAAKFSPEDRAIVAQLLDECRRHGYTPTGIAPDGRIQWAVTVTQGQSVPPWRDGGRVASPQVRSLRLRIVMAVYDRRMTASEGLAWQAMDDERLVETVAARQNRREGA